MHYVAVVYVIFAHHFPFIRFLGSTLRIDAILTNISNDGCAVLEHQREIVASFLPNCSASHLPLRFCSAKTIFSRLIRTVVVSIASVDMGQFLDVICKITK